MSEQVKVQALKAHLALNVRNVAQSIEFYRKMLGIEPGKVRTGYAKFDVQNPPLNLTLNEHSFSERGALSHLGIQVASTDDVMAVREKWTNAGLLTRDEMQTSCCYALQDKTWVSDPEPTRCVRHEVQRQLDLVAAVGCATADDRLSLRVPADAWAASAQRLENADVDLGRPWILMHPGATAASRRYPPEHFARAARLLARRYGQQVVFTGTADERSLVDGIRAAMGAPSHSLAGSLTLAELAAVIARAPVLIANNTGPVHMAAALGTPVVDLYALTNPQHTPWRVASRVLSHDVPCKYCYKSVCPERHHDCLRRIAPEAVVRAACELLSEAPRVAPARRATLAIPS